MTAKQYLSQAFYIDKRINSKMKQVQGLRDMLTRRNVILSDMPGNPNKNRSIVEEYTVKMIDLEREIDCEIDRLVSLKADILRTIQSLDDTECKVLLEDRYLNMMKWDEVAYDMCISLRSVHNIHSRALQLVGSR